MASAAPPVQPLSWWLLPALWLGVALAYGPAWHGAVLWDDAGHLTRGDLQSVFGLWRIWFEIGATQQYYPAVHSAFWVMHRLWGDNTLGYHLASITLHATSAYLVAVILRRLQVPGAVLAAAIFALHPVHVESVAWMSELKNTLSGVCYLSAALAYLRFDERRGWRDYSIALLFFIVAVLSKTVTATLPAALLVVFWWKRGRVSASTDVRPLVPFFAVAVVSGLMTAWFEHTLIGANGSEFDLSLIERVLVAGRAIWFYAGKLVWPTRLMFIYPKWPVSQAVWWQYLYPAGAALVMWLLWRRRAHGRAPVAAALLFCITLGPALGFVNVYPFRFSFVADHFQYLASIPIIAAFSAGAVTWCARAVPSLPSASAELILALVLGAPLALLTWTQSHQYVDAEGVLLATLRQNPECWMCHVNLAERSLREASGDPADAVAHLRAALRLHPNDPDAHYDLGTATERMGRLEEAVAEFREAVRERPAFGLAHLELGVALHKVDRPREAEVEFRQALTLRLAPTAMALVHYNLGIALAATGRLDQAAIEFEETLRITPDSAQAHEQLGYVLLQQGQPARALAHVTEAVRIDPASADAHDTLAEVLRDLDRPDEAIAQYRDAVRLAPDSLEYRNNLGMTLLNAGRPADAETEFKEALRRHPGAAMVQENLGLALAARRRGGK